MTFDEWWKGDLKDWQGHDSVSALHARAGWEAAIANSSPAAPVALTDERILEIAGCPKEHMLSIVVIGMARAIERAHGIGQEGGAA